MAKRVNWKRIERNLQKMKSTLPRQLGVVMLRHSKKAFRDQGFTRLDRPQPWKARSTKNRSDRRTTASRAILIESGALRRSLRVRTSSFSKIAVGSYGIPYAGRHNRGLDGMPRRQFIGKSKSLNNKLSRKIVREYKKNFKI